MDKPVHQSMSLDIDQTGLSEGEELAVITLLECLSRADKIEEQMYSTLDGDTDTVRGNPEPLATPLMRMGTAIAVGAQDPIQELVQQGVPPHQAIPLAIKSLVIQAFLAGIEYRKVTHPEKE